MSFWGEKTIKEISALLQISAPFEFESQVRFSPGEQKIFVAAGEYGFSLFWVKMFTGSVRVLRAH